MRRPIDDLLSLHLLGDLSAEERRHLFQAALEDQALFDRLADVEEWREVLSDGGLRADLVADLGRPRPPWWRRWLQSGGVVRLALVGVAATVGVVVIGVAIQQRVGAPSGSAGTGLPPAEPWGKTLGTGPAGGPSAGPEQPRASRTIEELIFAAPLANPFRVSVEVSGADNGPNRQIRLTLTSERAGQALLVERLEDGTYRRLFPNRWQPRATIQARRTIAMPPAGQGTWTVEGPPGTREIRLLVAPPEVDVANAGQVDLALATGQAALASITYRVSL